MSDRGTTRTRARTRRERGERPDGLLTTGDMARLSSNTLRTVRFYEETGILRPDRRSAGGHRLFHQRELERLRFVTDLRTAGLSLDQIRKLLELKASSDSGQAAATEMRRALSREIESLDERIRAFSRLRRELKQAHEVLQGCCQCDSDERFPDACDGCDSLTTQGRLPQSLRVLWGLE